MLLQVIIQEVVTEFIKSLANMALTSDSYTEILM